jgi:LPS export ABC transporter permease LptF/LPS export ABC transporter permease LptG
MLTGRKLVARYIILAAVPYCLLTLALLTAILFTQQGSKFAELALYTQLNFSLIGEIGAALLPSVLILTLPISVLAGIVIGFARMGTDSEVIAMRAAGIGTWSMLWPVLVLGVVVSFATTYLNVKEGPEAARDLKRAAVQGALAKLDSPVEPRTFTTEIPGYVIYVRDGDRTQGTWGRVFIYAPQQDNSTQILTARSGRIDSSADKSELVLSDAVKAKIPTAEGDQKSYVVERFDQLRLAINTGRAALIKSLDESDLGPEEMRWSDLMALAKGGSEPVNKAAQRTVHRKLALSISPLVFALVAGAIGLRVRRGGRSVGVLVSLVIVVVYYLTSLLGESLARVGTVSAIVGLWMATAFMLCLSFLFLLGIRSPRLMPLSLANLRKRKREATSTGETKQRISGLGEWGFPSLLDVNLFRTLTTSFVLGFISLVSIFIIFTLFELWRFIAANRIKGIIVFKYLVFLCPLITVELFPATMLIAVLITYALLARRSEAIAWWASGQSVYRLMLPGLFFAIAAGAGAWLVQEHLMPYSNIRQDALRVQIRGGEPRVITGTGRQWLASAESNRLYSYEFDDQNSVLHEPTIYELDAQGVHLSGVVTGSSAYWSDGTHLTIKDAQVIGLKGLEVEQRKEPETVRAAVDPPQVFKPSIDKPSQLSARGLSAYLKAAKRRGVEVSALATALQRKYASPFGVMIMALLGMPLALGFGRRGAIIALCAAVAVSIAYWGVGGGFQQLGEHGLLPAAVAGWAPLVIFAAAGVYFLSRLRT